MIERAARLALSHGLLLKIGADGSVEITGRLDFVASPGLSSEPNDADEVRDYEAWKRENLSAGRK